VAVFVMAGAPDSFSQHYAVLLGLSDGMRRPVSGGMR
jgi:hypothetical protein